METLFFLIIALCLAALVGVWGSTRKIGFGWAFLLSLFNLLIGIIAVVCSSKLPEENRKTTEKESL